MSPFWTEGIRPERHGPEAFEGPLCQECVPCVFGQWNDYFGHRAPEEYLKGNSRIPKGDPMPLAPRVEKGRTRPVDPQASGNPLGG